LPAYLATARELFAAQEVRLLVPAPCSPAVVSA
jgi:hypothetical protein